MKQETTRSRLCANACSIKSKQGARAGSLGSGRPEKRRCLRCSTKKQAAGTRADGNEEIPEKPEEVGQAKVAYTVREEKL